MHVGLGAGSSFAPADPKRKAGNVRFRVWGLGFRVSY